MKSRVDFQWRGFSERNFCEIYFIQEEEDRVIRDSDTKQDFRKDCKGVEFTTST